MKTDEFYNLVAQSERAQTSETTSHSARSKNILSSVIVLTMMVVGCGLFWDDISAARSDLISDQNLFSEQNLELRAQKNPIYDLVISPLGSALLYRDHRGQVYQQELVSDADHLGSSIDLFPGRACDGMKMSPVENRLVASFESGEVLLKDLESEGTEIELLGPGKRIIESLDFSPDGRLVAAGISNGSVLVWDIDSGETVSVIRRKGQTAFSVLFDSPSSLLVSFENGLERWIFKGTQSPATRLRKKMDFRLNMTLARELAVTSNGKTLLATSFFGTISCWDLETQEKLWEQKGELPCARSLQISRDGQRFACHADVDTITIRDLKTGEPEIWLTDSNMGTGTGSRFSLDGNLLYSASSDGMVRIWTVTGQSLIGTINTISTPTF